MEFSLNWLKRYVKTSMDETQIAEVFTAQGLTVDEIIEKENDTVFDIDVTTNRPDAMNYVGLARELHASGQAEYLPVNINLEECGTPVSDYLTVDIQNPVKCPRYVAKVVKDITVVPSPQWLVELLESTGIRPINNIVDITNFVLWETGQPLHAFDYTLLEGKKIIIRDAEDKETFNTLDSVERKLSKEDLVIADKFKPVALAGVMGGENSEINDNTTTVVIESAAFEPVTVRKTSKKFALHTDASHRFERGCDVGIAEYAASRAAALMAELGGGSVCCNTIDNYPSQKELLTITLRYSQLKKITGTNIPNDFVKSSLTGLGFILKNDHPEQAVFEIPSFRVDISREIDLIEEVLRLYGLDNVESTLPSINTSGREITRLEEITAAFEKGLLGSGYSEAITYSFCSEKDNLAINPSQKDMVVISNPLSETISTMRTSILSTLVKSVEQNIKHGTPEVMLYETGRHYIPSKECSDETRHIAGAATKTVHRKLWTGNGMTVDFFHVKGIIETILTRQFSFKTLSFRPETIDCFSETCSCGIYIDSTKVGIIGELSKKVVTHFDCDIDIIAFEINLDVLSGLESRKLFLSPYSVYPAVERDSAFLIDKRISFNELIDFINQLETPLLSRTSVFDRYDGKGIPSGKVSLALNFTFQSHDRTLSSEEVTNLHTSIVSALMDKFGIELR